METDTANLEDARGAYKAAVDAWVRAIREEEALASQADSLAEVDKWEAAHAREEEFRNAAKEAKRKFEEAIRQVYFGF